MKNFFRICFILCFLIITFGFVHIFLRKIFIANSIIIPYGLKPFDICKTNPFIWKYIKISYIVFLFTSTIIISNTIFSRFYNNVIFNKKKKKFILDDLHLNIGTNIVYKNGLLQNFLITGSIGSGKTSSAMYPFTKQLISYKANLFHEKLGMLILDVKGNYHVQVNNFVKLYNREDDLIIIELGGKTKYNPLHKPNLKPSVLAHRLKTILTLFSTNNGDQYWLDKAEQTICEAIKLCRIYNDGYVTFEELHKLISFPNYIKEKRLFLKEKFRSGILTQNEIFDLSSAIDFFDNEFNNLDSRVISIIKSEITRITSVFVNDLDVYNTFCTDINSLTFSGFDNIIDEGKIVVLNMNIAEYDMLSKIIATYLKLDFQSEVLSNISHKKTKICAFICDEYHEYVTSTDSAFFSQSREAQCINIVATQSYSSLLNTLKDSNTTKVIIQNLINKLWFRNDDLFTIEEAQKQIGKEEKIKISKSISENGNYINYNYLLNNFISQNSSFTESINSYSQNEFIYDYSFFTQNLETFSCIAFLSDGNISHNIRKS